MNKKAERFYDAITLLPEDIVEEAQDYVFTHRVPWVKYAGLAACLTVVLFAGWFGLMMAGGMGGSSAGADNNAPAAPADTAAPPSGDTSAADTTAPDYNGGLDDPQEPEGSLTGGSEEHQLTAIVLEVRENVIVVTPVEYDSNYEVEVSTVGLDVPALSEGDRVVVTYDGMIQETYPARITGASAIKKAEE